MKTQIPNLDGIMALLKNVHKELLEASKLCEESNEKWLRGESLGLDRLDELVKMNIDSIERSLAFNERVKASGREFNDIDSFLKESRDNMNDLLKEGVKYGLPERKEGEAETDHLKRVMDEIRKDFPDLNKPKGH